MKKIENITHRHNNFFKRIRLAICSIVFIFVLSNVISIANVNAATVYVSPGQSIQTAVNNASAGDTIIVNDGTYNERITVSNKSNIIIQSANNRGAKINGTGINLNAPSGYGTGLFQVDNSDHITIQGFDITKSTVSGVQINNSSYISIVQNYVNDVSSSGIQVHASSNLLVDGNEIYLAGNVSSSVTVQEVLSFERVSNYEIKNNNIHDSGSPQYGAEGIDVKVGSSNGTIHDNIVKNVHSTGIYVDAWNTTQTNVKVYNNFVQNGQYQGIGLSAEVGGTLDGIEVYNNVSIDSDNGIVIPAYNEGSNRTDIQNIKIYNNTIYNNNVGISLGGYPSSFVDNLSIYNNLLLNKGANISWNTQGNFTNTTISYNYFEVTGSNLGTNYKTGNPLFVNPAADFHLQSSSPAIDAGTSTGAPSTDYDDAPRPVGAGIDMGAFEYGGVVPPPPSGSPTPPPPSPTPCPAGLRFMSVGDVHINTNDIYSLDRLKQVVSFANEAYSQGKLDFIVFVGDIADNSIYEQDAATIINGLNPSLIRYKVAGNHDILGSSCVSNCPNPATGTSVPSEQSCVFQAAQGVYPKQFYTFVSSGNTYNIIIPGICADQWGGLAWYFNFNDPAINKSLPTLLFTHGPLDGNWGSFYGYASSLNNYMLAFPTFIGSYAGHIHSDSNQLVGNIRYVINDVLGGGGVGIGYTRVNSDNTTDYQLINYTGTFTDPFGGPACPYPTPASPLRETYWRPRSLWKKL